MPASAKSLAIAARSLERLMDSGVTIVRALRVAADATRNIMIRRAFRSAAASLECGDSVDKAFRPQRNTLSTQFVETIIAGQHAGGIHMLLPVLVESLETRAQARRTILTQLLYPLAILFAMKYAIPFFSGFILSDRNEFDYTLRFLKGMAWDCFYLAMLFAVFSIGRRIKYVRWTVSYILSWIWPLRNVLLRLAMARYLYVLAAMLKAGHTNREAAARAIPIADNPMVAIRVRAGLHGIQHGGTISDALQQTRLIPTDQILQLQVAEQTGVLEDGAVHCARQLIAEALHPVGILLANLQAIAIVILGIYIARSLT